MKNRYLSPFHLFYICGDVDRYDFSLFAQAYGTSVGHTDYDMQCDFDLDGDVDRYDFGISLEEIL